MGCVQQQVSAPPSTFLGTLVKYEVWDMENEMTSTG
jgi:hypothetical protein